MKIKTDATQLKGLTRQLKLAKAKLADRGKLHREFRKYMSSRWMSNLRSGGSIYGAFAAPLKRSTINVRRWRGYASGPILYQAGGGGGGKLRAWTKEAADAADIIISPAFSSTHWDFTFSGARDGSYAVLHSQGYNAGGAGAFINFRGKPVPQRKIFELNEEDYDELIERTGRYVSEAFGGMI